MKRKQYKPWQPDQLYLLPPSPREWLSKDHLVYFLLDIIGELDVSAIERQALGGDPRGEQPYNSRMMLALLIYGYCTGVRSSRKIERATYESVPFRVLAGGCHPDHSRISDFRKTHIKALKGLFLQILRICQKAGLVKLGHVALDGTKIKANASKHKAMSHERMMKREAELEAEIAQLLLEAAASDAAEDAEFGKNKRGDELPKELARREKRLETIRKARAELEAEAKAARAKQVAEREAAKRTDPPDSPAPPVLPTHQVAHDAEGAPKPKAQRNFTDSDSRIMKQGSDFQQAYNCQNVVDAANQIIVAEDVTNQPPDAEHLPAMVDATIQNTGATPDVMSADAGYWSAENDDHCEKRGIDAHIAIRRQKHGENVTEAMTDPADPAEPTARAERVVATARAEPTASAEPTEPTASAEPTAPAAPAAPLNRKKRMMEKLATERGRAIYARRKVIVEPPFGHIKANRGFRQFLLRGIDNVRGEWTLACMCHNLLKLFTTGAREPRLALAGE